jgi:tetratricopeptide (TPR) repeat protein
MTRMTPLVLLTLALWGASTLVTLAEELDEMVELESATAPASTAPVIGDAAERDAEPEGPADVALMPREALEQEVLAARAEVARMKDLVRRIVIANRREKSQAHYNMGCVYRESGKVREAERAFLAAERHHPNDSAVQYNLGILYEEDLGLRGKARKHYQRFIELAPNDPDAGLVYEWLTSLTAE